MFFVHELIYITAHGPFDTKEEAEAWIQGQDEPELTDTVFQVDEVDLHGLG